MEAIIQVRQRGSVTLPSEIRTKYRIKAGDTLRLIDLNGIFVLTPIEPMVPQLAREIERARLQAGLTTKAMFKGLREQRERYSREKYSR
jgi:AbrB family looped-hinge helix DNA binding protein